MTRIGIILGSTRPGRNGEAVAKWVYELAQKRDDATFELVDVADYNLPLYDEPFPAMMQQYTKEHTKVWSMGEVCPKFRFKMGNFQSCSL